MLCPICRGGNPVVVSLPGRDVSPCCVPTREELERKLSDAEDLYEFQRAGDEARAILAARATEPVLQPVAA